MKSWPVKDPNSNLKYWFDWRPWVAVEDGGEIVSYEVAIDEGDGALVIGDTAMSGGFVMLWLSGGTVDTRYVIRCRVTLTDTTTDDDSRELMIGQK
jgi:hypothetical protein